ncbi:hypothetical protein NBRC116188_23310 [Oceaniserpentilla sp. 4NH20-0058]|uniref:SURF1 family protein n=1 Tax=Oceaniserpentilla sp. 4NH20-0058 TaxID=3127660 RepID=UPI003102447B
MSNPLILNVNRNWHFEIKPLYSLVMLIGVSICLLAAGWQYSKSYQFKAVVYEKIIITGRFLNEYSLFLDNQTRSGRAGYAVITPFSSNDKTYLVNRGFVPYETRNVLPKIEDAHGGIEISGIIKPYKTPVQFSTQIEDSIPNRIQSINFEDFSKTLNYPLSDEIFIQQSGKGMLAKQDIKAPYLSFHRHQGYALQWFLLAICGLLILLAASLKRDN